MIAEQSHTFDFLLRGPGDAGRRHPCGAVGFHRHGRRHPLRNRGSRSARVLDHQDGERTSPDSHATRGNPGVLSLCRSLTKDSNPRLHAVSFSLCSHRSVLERGGDAAPRELFAGRLSVIFWLYKCRSDCFGGIEYYISYALKIIFPNLIFFVYLIVFYYSFNVFWIFCSPCFPRFSRGRSR